MMAVTGTVLAALFVGDVATSSWSPLQTVDFRLAVMMGSLALTGMAAAFVGWGILRVRGAEGPASTSSRITSRGSGPPQAFG